MTRIYFIRHGQATSNESSIWTSIYHGYPLTELGQEQAKAAGESLRGAGIGAVYSSHVHRAQQTASVIGAVLGLTPTAIDGVQELHVGVHEGRHNDEVAPIAQDVFTAWLGTGDLSGGFEGGETGQEVIDRFGIAVDSLVAQAPGRTIAVVSHGGALALALSAHCDNVSAPWVARHILRNCAIIAVDHQPGGHWHSHDWDGILEPR